MTIFLWTDDAFLLALTFLAQMKNLVSKGPNRKDALTQSRRHGNPNESLDGCSAMIDDGSKPQEL